MKDKYLLAFMDMAERFALTSEAQRLKVAAMVIKNGSILTCAINGTPSGWYTNVCEDEQGKTAYFTLHAEEQALNRMLHLHETTIGATMLVTHACCPSCSIRVKAAGITQVYYRHTYRDLSGIEYLKQNGVLVKQI